MHSEVECNRNSPLHRYAAPVTVPLRRLTAQWMNVDANISLWHGPCLFCYTFDINAPGGSIHFHEA